MVLLGVSIAAVGGGIAYAVARQPDTFRVTRSLSLKAPPAVIFGLVNDFQNWRSWSPWEGLDPALQRTYTGAAKGVGAAYAWSGNNKAGAGSMTIAESAEPKQITIALTFTRPMAAKNTAEFRFEACEGGTQVTWSLFGDNTLMGKVFSLVVGMDKLLGKSLEDGLRKLGEVASQAA
ncbi:MAG: hypothetical protein RL385_2720 [Pseudomonadota bacterium]